MRRGTSRAVVRSSYLLLVLVLLSGGCTPGSGAVTGKVTYQGKPLAGATVIFHDAANNAASSPIYEDGSYTVPKVATGKARISVQVPMAISLPGEKPKADKPDVSLPPRYSDPDQSGLTYDVQRGSQTHDLTLD